MTIAKIWPGEGTVDITLTDDTDYRQCTGLPGQGAEIDCVDLAIDDLVRIVGDREEGLVAHRVILYPPEE